ncbi:DUF2459 domain-containing protein [Aurantiacibacter poecillastricola]|uniref:DUF2459 domain-containing protein n=1 Tax=Aurantiacibacter poecillastricola TaxID=3064385 RepID=UPI00273F54E6|nr:DUF2459 domain-containing protein [Aurantiacibacter sp. 219JJ12-13]MDP5261820.1 DUF2459 domain-containing protein [Aurantiacibacter sp. 219JJ12-13]
MATPSLQRIGKHLARISLAALGTLVLLGAGYPLAGWIGSSIPETSPAAFTPQDETVQIMVETNGTHTSIIVPVITPEKDWRETFPSAALPRPDGFMPTHLALGWGEREVFLYVPTWGDLKPLTALRIATVGGDALMRVSHYLRPAPSQYHRPLRISRAQYSSLVSAIERALPQVAPGETRERLQGTYTDDAYYEARGTYTLANTCNTWVGDMLVEASVEMGMWTPFAGGVMKWIPAPALGEAHIAS